MVGGMTFKRIAAAITAAVLATLTFAVPASADTVPIKADAALCQVPCERGAAETAPVSKALAAPANCRYNASVCGYESFNYLCDDGCEVIPFSTAGGCEAVALPNQWSSFWNNSGRTVRLYKTANCTSSYLTYYSSTGEDYFLTSGQTSWENAVRSVRFI